MSFVHNVFLIWKIILKYLHSIPLTLSVMQNLKTCLQRKMGVLDEQDFAISEFRMSFGRISYIAASRGAV